VPPEAVTGSHVGSHWRERLPATATNTAGRPIKIGGGFPRAAAIAITPGGRTVYVVRASARRTTVTPVASATNTAGRPVKIGRIPKAIAITPADGGGMLQKLLPRP
jgi:DNA-binding beta-propeller fold protein YncE